MTFDFKKLFKGDRRTLAKLITVIESKLDENRKESQTILETILPRAGKSIRIGITGIPGVGKSTFIESLGLSLIKKGFKVAVLAVDPSSPISGGSLMGDKTRMEELSRSNLAFIRPSPTSGSLGGVAQKTRETMLLCEAAGYDVILIETVGVGQSEVEVASMVDFFLVLMLPNSGDELQGIKKGILELADMIVVNKADGESVTMAETTAQHYRNAFHLLIPHSSFWHPKVKTCSAVKNINIDKIWDTVMDFKNLSISNDQFDIKRAAQNREWMWKLVHEMLDLELKRNQGVMDIWPIMEKKVTSGETTPYFAAKKIIELFKI